MRWIVRGLVLLMALVIAVLAIGYLLPVDHVASVQARVEASPERVWGLVNDVASLPRWRSDVTHVEAREEGDGARVWTEVGSTGRLPMEVVEARPPERLVVRIVDDGLPFGGTWTYSLVPDASGTLLTITENGNVYNPFFRFVSRFVMGHEGTLRRYLTDLTRELGGEVLSDSG